MAVADRTEGPLRAKAQRRGLLCLGGVARRAAEVRGIRRAGPLPGGHPRVERLLERGEWLGGPATVAKAKASAAWTLSGSVWVGASLPKGTPAMWPGSHTKKTGQGGDSRRVAHACAGLLLQHFLAVLPRHQWIKNWVGPMCQNKQAGREPENEKKGDKEAWKNIIPATGHHLKHFPEGRSR